MSSPEIEAAQHAAREKESENGCNTRARPDEYTDVGLRERLWAEAMRAERRGDTAAYERLLKDIADWLRRLIRHRLARLGLHIHEAEDLVQEVLMGLHLKRHTWDADRPFLPWLHAIAHYKLVDAMRRLRREAKHRIDVTLEDLSELLAAPMEDADRALDMNRHLSQLASGQQTVARALAIEGDSVKATAARLSTSEAAVRVTFHRALRRLAAMATADRSDAAKPRVKK